MDRYDQQQFTCPTDRIFSNLLNGYRPNTQQNENIFRRKWPGTKSDLINTIRNGSIDAFCDPKNPGMSNNNIYDCLHECALLGQDRKGDGRGKGQGRLEEDCNFITLFHYL